MIGCEVVRSGIASQDRKAFDSGAVYGRRGRTMSRPPDRFLALPIYRQQIT